MLATLFISTVLITTTLCMEDDAGAINDQIQQGARRSGSRDTVSSGELTGAEGLTRQDQQTVVSRISTYQQAAGDAELSTESIGQPAAQGDGMTGDRIESGTGARILTTSHSSRDSVLIDESIRQPQIQQPMADFAVAERADESLRRRSPELERDGESLRRRSSDITHVKRRRLPRRGVLIGCGIVLAVIIVSGVAVLYFKKK